MALGRQWNDPIDHDQVRWTNPIGKDRVQDDGLVAGEDNDRLILERRLLFAESNREERRTFDLETSGGHRSLNRRSGIGTGASTARSGLRSRAFRRSAASRSRAFDCRAIAARAFRSRAGAAALLVEQSLEQPALVLLDLGTRASRSGTGIKASRGFDRTGRCRASGRRASRRAMTLMMEETDGAQSNHQNRAVHDEVPRS